MTTTTKHRAGQAPASPGTWPAGVFDAMPPLWVARAKQLAAFLDELAEARHRATITHAEAFLAATGGREERAETAKKKAAQDQLEAARAQARVEAYRLVLDATIRAEQGGID